MIKRRTLLVQVVAVVMIVVMGVAYYSLNEARPGFPGASISYDESRLQSAATNGKPTLIYFSTPDCPICLMEDRVMDSLLYDYNFTVNFVFMKLSSNNGKLFQDWSILVVPTLLLANDEGTIEKRYDGYAGESDLRTDLQRLL